jgi:hypothetical protein
MWYITFTRFFNSNENGTMKSFSIPIVMLICLFSVNAMAQSGDSAHHKRHKFALYAGAGPNYYFNNLQLAKSYASVYNYSIVGRIMWEPEHFLSLGLETGYYRLYTMKSADSNDIHIANSAVPIQIVVSMKFLHNFYFNASLGQSLLMNDVHSSKYGNFDAKSFSPGDFTATLGSKIQVNDRFSIGAETKFFYSSRANDCNLAFVFIGGISF